MSSEDNMAADQIQILPNINPNSTDSNNWDSTLLGGFDKAKLTSYYRKTTIDGEVIRYTCKYCCFPIDVTSTSLKNLAHHLKEKHGIEGKRSQANYEEEEVNISLNPKTGVITAVPNFTPSRKTSLVWKFFVGLDKLYVKCKICNGIFTRPKGNTSNLLAHLRSKHQHSYREILKEKSILNDLSLEDNKEHLTSILNKHNNNATTSATIKTRDFTNNNNNKTSLSSSSSNNNNKTTIQRTFTWNYFTYDESTDSATCRFCDYVIHNINNSSNNNNNININNNNNNKLIKHLLTAHIIDVKDDFKRLNECLKNNNNSNNNNNNRSKNDDNDYFGGSFIVTNGTDGYGIYGDYDNDVKYSTKSSYQTRPRTSYVWGHFRKISLDWAQCTHCDRMFKQSKCSTTSLIKHLQRFHPIEVDRKTEKMNRNKRMNKMAPKPQTFSRQNFDDDDDDDDENYDVINNSEKNDDEMIDMMMMMDNNNNNNNNNDDDDDGDDDVTQNGGDGDDDDDDVGDFNQYLKNLIPTAANGLKTQPEILKPTKIMTRRSVKMMKNNKNNNKNCGDDDDDAVGGGNDDSLYYTVDELNCSEKKVLLNSIVKKSQKSKRDSSSKNKSSDFIYYNDDDDDDDASNDDNGANNDDDDDYDHNNDDDDGGDDCDDDDDVKLNSVGSGVKSFARLRAGKRTENILYVMNKMAEERSSDYLGEVTMLKRFLAKKVKIIRELQNEVKLLNGILKSKSRDYNRQTRSLREAIRRIEMMNEVTSQKIDRQQLHCNNNNNKSTSSSLSVSAIKPKKIFTINNKHIVKYNNNNNNNNNNNSNDNNNSNKRIINIKPSNINTIIKNNNANNSNNNNNNSNNNNSNNNKARKRKIVHENEDGNGVKAKFIKSEITDGDDDDDGGTTTTTTTTTAATAATTTTTSPTTTTTTTANHNSIDDNNSNNNTDRNLNFNGFVSFSNVNTDVADGTVTVTNITFDDDDDDNNNNDDDKNNDNNDKITIGKVVNDDDDDDDDDGDGKVIGGADDDKVVDDDDDDVGDDNDEGGDSVVVEGDDDDEMMCNDNDDIINEVVCE